MKLCECGCGEPTKMIMVARPNDGIRKGDYRRFVYGHQRRKAHIIGYKKHGFGAARQYVHRLRAARALGKPLPDGAEVHHADGGRDEHGPLVICQDAAYHSLLHARMRIRAAGGNPDTDRVCSMCKAVKPRTEFYRHKDLRHKDGYGLDFACKPCTKARLVARQAQPAAGGE